MARAAELAGAIKVLHHRLGVAIEMGQDLLVRNLAVDGLVLGVHQHRGLGEDITAGAARIHFLDGVAHRAGDAVGIEAAIDRRTRGQRAGSERDGIVATLAMTRVFDAARADQKIDVLHVPGIAEGIGVHGLPPLRIGLLMAVSAIVGREEVFRVNKLAGIGGGIRRQKRLIGGEGKPIVFGHALGVDSPGRGGIFLRVGRAQSPRHECTGARQGKQQTAG